MEPVALESRNDMEPVASLPPVKLEPPGDDEAEPVSLSALPPDLIAEIAFRVTNLRSMRSSIRFNLPTVAATRIQRFYRRVRASLPRLHDIHVGDRVCFTPHSAEWAVWPHSSLAHSRGIKFGTADGEVATGVWKIRQVAGEDAHVPTRRVYRLQPWEYSHRDAAAANAVSHAASAAREAATFAAQAALAVLHSPSGAGAGAVQLALAAATTASTAATAATAAASAVNNAVNNAVHSSAVGGAAGGAVPLVAAAPINAHVAMTEAHGMLEAHERLVEAATSRRAGAGADAVPHTLSVDAHAAMAEAHELLASRELEILEAQAAARAEALGAGGAHVEARVAETTTSFGEGGATLTAGATRRLLREATEAAAVASAQASVATHAAGTVCSSAVTSATTGTASTTAAVAHNLVAAMDALASRHLDAEGATAASALPPEGHFIDPMTVASDAIGAIGAAQHRLSTACTSSGLSSGAPRASSAAGATPSHSQALLATQRAAGELADALADAAEEKKQLPPSAKVLEGAPRRWPRVGEMDDIDALTRDGARAVLWCWIPRSSKWTTAELLERTTRAVAACRADDLIALPDLPAARELVEHWCATDYGADRLRANSVIWFDPSPPTPPDATADPMFATIAYALESYGVRRRCHRAATATIPRIAVTAPAGGDVLYCMYPDARIAAFAARYGLRCLGDLDAHPVVGSLQQAKSFLHRSLAQPARPSLSDAALGAVRGPRGFCCETAEQLQDAWQRLVTEHPGIRLVLKPASGSGGAGVVLNATKADVDVLACEMAAQEAQAPLQPQGTRMGRFVVRPAADAPRLEDTILEEMVGAPGQPSPTVYMVGRRVAVVADQLLSPCGTLNMGNVSPAAQVDALLTDAMSAACVELGTYLGLVGQWGVDFVLDEHGTPVMVDLNLGRPNGSLSYYCWRARQPDPQFALVASTFCLPEGLTLAPFAESLKAAGRLWDAKRRSGIILAQHLPGSPDGGTVLSASCEGTAAARHVLDGFFTHAKAYLADLA